MNTVRAANGSMPSRQTEQLAVEMAGVHKWYGEFHVLRDINLAVSPG